MLELVLAPDPIYKTICTPVPEVTDAVRGDLEAMMQTLRANSAMGLGAPMVGLTQRLVVIDLEDENGAHHVHKMVNPVVTEQSAETATMEEASITFLGISAPVTRPVSITVSYQDETGTAQTLRATGIVSVCIQHEIDYLDGKTIIDYQSPMKRDMLKRRLEKQKRLSAPHVHGAHCNH